jgi:hypothetical protein
MLGLSRSSKLSIASPEQTCSLGTSKAIYSPKVTSSRKSRQTRAELPPSKELIWLPTKMVIANDEYSIWRTAPDASRLCYQHFCWRELHKSNIHPSIDLRNRENLRIAELAAGHCLWAIQVAEEYPQAQVEASDISLGLVPPKPDLPANLSVRKWSFFDPVPKEWRGAFDLLHVRLIIQPFGGNQDPRPVLEKFVSMLS